MTAFPGATLYDRLLAEGRVLTSDAWELCTLFDINYERDFAHRSKPGKTGKTRSRLRWLTTHPCQAGNEMTRWLFRGWSYMRRAPCAGRLPERGKGASRNPGSALGSPVHQPPLVPSASSVPSAGEGVPPSRTSMTRRFRNRSRNQQRRGRKVRFGGTPKPARETRALPGFAPAAFPPRSQAALGNALLAKFHFARGAGRDGEAQLRGNGHSQVKLGNEAQCGAR